jgi:creatinine amidohydrolase
MRFEEINWMDVESYLARDDRVMLVLGACEQHGYLSILTDSLVPQALADAASQETQVLVAPALNFGVSPYFLTFPGTISFRSSTYLAVFEDLLNSLIQSGFKRFLILNGHGGNHLATGLTAEILNQHPEVKIAWYSWWQAPAVTHVFQKHALKAGHASWMEAFPFTRVADIPEGQMPLAETGRTISAEALKKDFPDGVMGYPYQVETAIMDEIFQTALANVLHMLKFED